VSKPLLELNNIQNWDLIKRETYSAANQETNGSFDPIPSFSVTCPSNIIAVGTKNPYAKPSWQLGTWLFPCLFVAPSSFSEFVALMQTNRYAVPLDRLALFQMPDYLPKPYLLYFQPPKWHRELLIEVWYYSGIESTSIEQKLDDIDNKLNTLIN
jgi:hypothetical protein